MPCTRDRALCRCVPSRRPRPSTPSRPQATCCSAATYRATGPTACAAPSPSPTPDQVDELGQAVDDRVGLDVVARHRAVGPEHGLEPDSFGAGDVVEGAVADEHGTLRVVDG